MILRPSNSKNIILIAILFTTLFSYALAQTAPRQIADNKKSPPLDFVPQRIVSTSVTLTGLLLAIDAPVIASGATFANTSIADEQGFFHQWGALAKKRHVQRLYIGKPSVEAVAVQSPDLILVSATGADSALPYIDQLSAIAPTLVVNYDDKSWQQVLTELGSIIGHKQQAVDRIADFNVKMEKTRTHITLPPQPINALVYQPLTKSANLFTEDSAQGKLLIQLGFTLAKPPATLQHNSWKNRRGIIHIEGENLITGINGNSLLLFANDDHVATSLMNEPLLKHIPAVKYHRVWALGNETFRLDYYSAILLLNRIDKLFGKP